MSSGHHGSKQQPERRAEKARSEKPLSISSTAIISQPKPKPIIMPAQLSSTSSGRTWVTAKPPVVHRHRNRIRMTQRTWFSLRGFRRFHECADG